MPTREVLVCSKCGSTIEEDPMLGDRQGSRVRIVHGAYTWNLVLCTKCKQPLFDAYEQYVDEVLPGGTATGVEALKYLPRLEKEDDGQAKPDVPEFRS